MSACVENGPESISGWAHRQNTCVPRAHKKGRFRSGQTGQTVNLLALRLRWFESSPAQPLLPL